MVAIDNRWRAIPFRWWAALAALCLLSTLVVCLGLAIQLGGDQRGDIAAGSLLQLIGLMVPSVGSTLIVLYAAMVRVFFIRLDPARQDADRPESLWRYTGTWAHFSPVDWRWQPIPDKAAPSGLLFAVTATRARQLVANRQLWIDYGLIEQPAPTVMRRWRRPGGGGSWEVLGPDAKRWTAYTLPAGSVRPIDVAEAEALLQRIRGVTGATDRI